MRGSVGLLVGDDEVIVVWVDGAACIAVVVHRVGGMHCDAVKVADGGNAKLVEMEDVGVEGSSDARMPNVGISTAHSISYSLMDIGGLESLGRHEKGSGVEDGSIGRDGDDIKLLVGIKT